MIGKYSSVETLSVNGFQTPYNDITNDSKPVLFSVSSNIYYGYQPLNTVQNTVEPMHTEESIKGSSAMDTMRLESPVNRKRTRNNTEATFENCKKRRQNESLNINSPPQRCSSGRIVLDEDLLRETHGCSYYHWIASNI